VTPGVTHSEALIARRVPARRSLARARSLQGIGYATPTAVIVGVFFLVPLGLVFWMSVNRWPLLGSPELNLPDNYTKIPDN
jgi:multiple sugar transport system permease protein